MTRATINSRLSSLASAKRPDRRLIVNPLILSLLLLFIIFAMLNWMVYQSRNHQIILPVPLHIVQPPAEGQKQRRIAHPSVLSQANLPTYTREQAAQAISTTSWICGDKDALSNEIPRPFISFVHVYKTAGSTLRRFFANYANVCRKSLMIIVGCTGLKHSALKSKQSQNWNGCRLKATVDAREGIAENDEMDQRVYPKVNNTVLYQQFDILAGHYRFGLTDYVFPQIEHDVPSKAADVTPSMHHVSPQVKHIVFLRKPEDRYVSSILYRAKQFSMNKKETVQDTAEYIKKRVLHSRGKNEYVESIFKYLLTPEQTANIKLDSNGQSVEYKTWLAIQNLVNYNAIVGMTEYFSESMQILQHALMPDEFASENRKERMGEMFDEYTSNSNTEQSSNKDEAEDDTSTVRQNQSQMGAISTSSVMEELRNDDSFMIEFREYLKYEQVIVDFAMKMHRMQYDLVIEANRKQSYVQIA